MTPKTEPMTRRDWYYAMPPSAFEVAPCVCGNADTQWSEFKEHCWCDRCQVDFKPAHAGIFDGPIPMGACEMLGLRFDRVIIATMALDRYDTQAGRYESEKPPAVADGVLAA